MSFKIIKMSSVAMDCSVDIMSRAMCEFFGVSMCCNIFSKIYGIDSMAQFSFPLIIGIATGCYSSIFIASPLYVMWKESQKKSKAKPVKA